MKAVNQCIGRSIRHARRPNPVVGVIRQWQNVRDTDLTRKPMEAPTLVSSKIGDRSAQIAHQWVLGRDWSAIWLLDHRYAQPQIQQQISGWLRMKLRHAKDDPEWNQNENNTPQCVEWWQMSWWIYMLKDVWLVKDLGFKKTLWWGEAAKTVGFEDVRS